MNHIETITAIMAAWFLLAGACLMTLRVVGFVHMLGIFVGMILVGSPVFAATSMQLIV